MPPVLTTLATFSGTDGNGPEGVLVDPAGNLIGLAQSGGINGTGPVLGTGYGTAFEIANTGSYSSTPTVLFSFDNTNTGSSPRSTLVADAAGNLYGTTVNGGTDKGGTVFEIAKTSGGGYAAMPTIIANSGDNPFSALYIDAAGDLFGTTTNNNGAVFEIPKSGAGAGTIQTIATFDGTDGSSLYNGGALIADAAGNLFGTADSGGSANDGVVFEIKTNGNGSFASTPVVIGTFAGANGSAPDGGLVMDKAGDLFGTTEFGGSQGTVYELFNNNGTYGAPTTIADTFQDLLYGGPGGTLLIDPAGNLFGTTSISDEQEVFEVPLVNGTYSSTTIQVANLGGVNGASSLSVDGSGDLFGTTFGVGGNGSFGTVFEVTGSGFGTVVACFRKGTRIATPDGERRVESLTVGDAVTTASGGTRAVVWVGSRTIDCGRHPNPAAVRPVRVAAGAFGAGRPTRDLFLSPDHAVFVEGVLVPIKRLIDGDAVRQVAARSVTYFHVELDAHDVVLAEGMPAESYLDTGDRSAFGEDVTVSLFPVFGADRASARWEAFGCARLVLRGPEVNRAREKLARAAKRLRRAA